MLVAKPNEAAGLRVVECNDRAMMLDVELAAAAGSGARTIRGVALVAVTTGRRRLNTRRMMRLSLSNKSTLWRGSQENRMRSTVFVVCRQKGKGGVVLERGDSRRGGEHPLNGVP